MFKDGLKNVYLSLAPSCGPLCHSVGERREHIECVDVNCECVDVNCIGITFFCQKESFLEHFSKFYQCRFPVVSDSHPFPNVKCEKNCDGALFSALLFPSTQILLFSIKGLTLQIQ